MLALFLHVGIPYAEEKKIVAGITMVPDPVQSRILIQVQWDTSCQNILSRWPVYEVKCLCSRGQE